MFWEKLVYRLREKNLFSNKNGNHCHLTGLHRDQAHEKCKINVKQNQSIFLPFVFHKFSEYDSHLLFKKRIDI